MEATTSWSRPDGTCGSSSTQTTWSKRQGSTYPSHICHCQVQYSYEITFIHPSNLRIDSISPKNNAPSIWPGWSRRTNSPAHYVVTACEVLLPFGAFEELIECWREIQSGLTISSMNVSAVLSECSLRCLHGHETLTGAAQQFSLSVSDYEANKQNYSGELSAPAYSHDVPVAIAFIFRKSFLFQNATSRYHTKGKVKWKYLRRQSRSFTKTWRTWRT